MADRCPCQSGRDLDSCCQPIIDGCLPAATAEALMRSRYTAFTLANADYLMKSHHPNNRSLKEKESIRKWAKSVKWLGLTVLEVDGGGCNDYSGTVTFKALFIENNCLQQIHERSMFERIGGAWVYVKGVHLK